MLDFNLQVSTVTYGWYFWYFVRSHLLGNSIGWYCRQKHVFLAEDLIIVVCFLRRWILRFLIIYSPFLLLCHHYSSVVVFFFIAFFMFHCVMLARRFDLSGGRVFRKAAERRLGRDSEFGVEFVVTAAGYLRTRIFSFATGLLPCGVGYTISLFVGHQTSVWRQIRKENAATPATVHNFTKVYPAVHAIW